MRLRPANISLINRRLYLLRLLLTLSSIERRPAQLDRSLHITSVLSAIRPLLLSNVRVAGDSGSIRELAAMRSGKT